MEERISKLLGCEEDSDFVLVVEGRVIPVHRFVLSSCEHFSVMFDCGMRESSASELVIEEFSYSKIISLLHVIYCGSCLVDTSNAVELLEVADFYKMVGFALTVMVANLTRFKGLDEVQV